jgi:hypothetical protein
MNSAQIRGARAVARRANAAGHGVTYVPAVDLPVVKVAPVVWYPVTARTPDGRTWLYYLRPCGGSYAGSYPA